MFLFLYMFCFTDFFILDSKKRKKQLKNSLFIYPPYLICYPNLPLIFAASAVIPCSETMTGGLSIPFSPSPADQIAFSHVL